MSYTSLSHDSCSYSYNLGQSVGPGDYMVNTPVHECNGCVSDNPYIRTSVLPVSMRQAELVDVGSELSGRTRHASACPKKQYLPIPKYNKVAARVAEDAQKKCDSFLHTEDTLLSNPKCTLRGQGINRWEWLPEDPQAHAITPFDMFRGGVNNRLVVKDNHRPCLPDIRDDDPALPPTRGSGAGDIPPPELPNVPDYGKVLSDGVRWKTCEQIRML